MKVQDLLSSVKAIQSQQLDESIDVSAIKTILSDLIASLQGKQKTDYENARKRYHSTHTYNDKDVEAVADMKAALTSAGILKYGDEIYNKVEKMMSRLAVDDKSAAATA